MFSQLSKFLKEYQGTELVVKWSYRGMKKCSPVKGLRFIGNSSFRVEFIPQTIKIKLFLQLLRLKLTVFAKSSNSFHSLFGFQVLPNMNLSKKINSKGVINNV